MTYTPQNLYGIGPDSAHITLLSALPCIAPRHSFVPFVSKDQADGSIAGVGFPAESWIWDFISLKHWTSLYAFRSGISTPVCIQTKNHEDQWFLYNCIMNWPGPQQWVVTRGVKFQLDFRHLIYTPTPTP